MAVTDEDLRPVPLSREQYDVLVAAGAFTDQRVELLEGTVVAKVPQQPIHSNHVRRITQHLVRRLAEAHAWRYGVSNGLPLAADRWSEPEPDIAVTDVDAGTDDAHPTTAHLVVEVSRSSIRRDLEVKPRVYSGAGVPRYWVIDVATRKVVVHTEPVDGDPRTGRDAAYGTIRRLPLDAGLELLGLTVRLSEIV
ncbi:MAG: Uma2 family endonuclease [Kineosporiaceae bacterium]